MVIEHTFVTTKPAGQTIQAALQFLSSGGFQQTTSAFPVQGEWTTLEVSRGKKKAARAKNITELPQTAHVQWDRGRVTVVLSIEASPVWGGSSASFGITVGSTADNPKKMKIHAQMLTAIASGLEMLLVRDAAPEAARQQWMAAETAARDVARRRRIRNGVIGAIVVALFILMIAVIVFASSSH